MLNNPQAALCSGCGFYRIFQLFYFEIYPILSATLHSYKIRLWSNYGYGKKRDAYPPGKHPAFRKMIKGENEDEQL